MSKNRARTRNSKLTIELDDASNSSLDASCKSAEAAVESSSPISKPGELAVDPCDRDDIGTPSTALDGAPGRAAAFEPQAPAFPRRGVQSRPSAQAPLRGVDLSSAGGHGTSASQAGAHELIGMSVAREKVPAVELAGARAPAKRVRLSRKVHVIVPVYNGFEDFQRLIESLFSAHPAPNPLLTFVFIDDASPDPKIKSFLESAAFERSDVIRLANESNRGFIGTVNRGLEEYCLAQGGSDVIILNTDTLVFGNVLAVLQDVAMRLPRVASVTPWSNNATIASMLCWPHGAHLPAALSPEVVASVVENAAIETPLADSPTGVGFCMYMKREAALLVGGFDAGYGKGYGEENDWCQKAARLGYVNVICTEAFVYHHGSASFGDETKRRQLEINMRRLGDAHPSYHSDVQRYLAADPLRAQRSRALWALRAHFRRSARLHTVLFMLHSDPSYYGGGTEKHVMALTDHLLESGGVEVMHLFPSDGGSRFNLRTYLPRGITGRQEGPLFACRFNQEDLFELLRAVAPEVDTLHVHHFLGWPRWLTGAISLFKHARRILTLHDYYSVCPSIRLLGRAGYCDVPIDLLVCNECLREVHGIRTVTIEEWRLANARMLQEFDFVITPSAAARAVIAKGLALVRPTAEGNSSHRASPEIEVVPNFVLDLPERLPPVCQEPASERPRVVFLGAYAEHKGAGLFDATAREAAHRGWRIEVWGALGQSLPGGVAHRTYTTSQELRQLGLQYPVDVVVLPAIWPETYSFTAFEAALDLRAPIVVGPYGNPRDLVERHGIGIALPSLTPEAYLMAVSRCLARRAAFAERLQAFEIYSRELSVASYFTRVYAHLREPRGATFSSNRQLPVPVNSAHLEEPAPVERPLRHQLVDHANHYVKSYAPIVHSCGRFLGQWVARRGRTQE